ncbi:unnamed protein product [Coregonus sp. 'balchen']|nr:unnamed protein product [Coregonus sp. 'balchen']
MTYRRRYISRKPGDTYEQSIEPNQHEVYGEEGSYVQLSCNYSSAYSLLWYKQPPGSAPQYILLILHSTGTVQRADSLDSHFSGKLNKKKTCVDLEISSAEVTDSALYYCALTPTVTGNPEALYKKLTFTERVFQLCSSRFHLSIVTSSTSVEDIITPDRDVVDVMKGSSVKLSCRYNSSLTTSLLWYRQHPGSSPQFFILDYVDLEIFSAEVTDSVLLCSDAQKLIAGEHITAVKNEVIITEGKPETLSCSYDASRKYPLLYWSWHYSNQAPRFLLYKGARSSTREHIPDKRYTSKTSQTSTELVITHLTLADTALYYCALRDFMRNWLILYVLAACCFGCRAEENVTQPTEDVMAVEGQQTTLTCLYDTTDRSPYLFWYKQQANGKPMFMLRKDTVGVGETAAEFKERFHARLNVTAKSVPLMIQRVQMSDSAVYYCALKPTVTTGDTAPLQKHCVCMWVHVYSGSHGNDITPTTDKVFGLEGDVIKLSCNYSSAEVIDSALYYCALQPTVRCDSGIKQQQEVCCYFCSSDNSLYFGVGLQRFILKDCRGEEGVDQQSRNVIALKGGLVTLSCNYTTSSPSPDLFWYN